MNANLNQPVLVPGSVSVIIPTFNEAENLAKLLPRLHASRPLEILVADGGSSDDSQSIAECHGARIIPDPSFIIHHSSFILSSQRARQMNTAARAATGDFLLFLHADTTPPENFPQIIRDTMAKTEVIAGAFRFALSGSLLAKGVIEKLVALRCVLWHSPYGDQGLFLRRSVFEAQGGFPEWPILEDVHFVRQLKRLGRIAITSQAALTSARRWQQHGVLRTFLQHQMILGAYQLGVPPEQLAKLRGRTLLSGTR